MAPGSRRGWRAAAAALVAACGLVPGPARAGDDPVPPPPPSETSAAPAVDLSTPAGPPAPPPGGLPELTDVTFESVLLTTTGFLTAFVVHEACHAVANLSMANVPTLEPVRFLGFFPFFAVSPGIQCTDGTCVKRDGTPFDPGPRGYGFIVSSGILCQEITNEIILTGNPRIREERKPFLKGMLLFNTAASVAYAIANLTGIEPPEGDLRSFEAFTGAPRGLMAGVVLATAALDVARYFLPDSAWLPWVSRGSKVVTLGLVVAF